MNYCTILNVYFIANSDAVHISPYYCIEPCAAIITHHHISHDGRIRSDETILSEFGVYIVDVHYDGHTKEFEGVACVRSPVNTQSKRLLCLRASSYQSNIFAFFASQ